MSQDRNEYIDLIAADDRKQKLQASMHVASGINPDERAKSEKIATATGIPLDVVERNPQDAKQAAIAKENDYVKMIRENPKLADWLSKPEDAAVSNDDISALSAIANGFSRGWARVGQMTAQVVGEELIQQSRDKERTFKEILKDVSGDEKIDTRGLPDITGFFPDVGGKALDVVSAARRYVSAGVFDKDESLGLAGQAFRGVGEQAKKISEIPKSAMAQKQQDAIMEAGEDGIWAALKVAIQDPVASLALSGEIALEMAPQLAVVGAATAITRSPAIGVGMMGATSFATERYSSPSEFLMKKGIDLTDMKQVQSVLMNPELMTEAQQYGFDRGVIIGAFDLASGGMASKVFGGAVKNLLIQSVAQSVLGGAGEAVAQLATTGEIDAGEVVLEAMAEFVSTPVDVAAIGAKKYSDYRLDVGRAKQATGRQELFEAMADGSKQSKLRERLPERFRAFIESVTKDGEIETINIPADKFNEYFQENDPFDLMDEIPHVFDQVSEALAIGGDIVIPIADFATYIAPREHFDGLKGDMRFHAGEMTMNESIEFDENKEALIEEMLAEEAEGQVANEVDARVFDSVYSQLRAAGRSDIVAKTEATSLTAFVDTMAQRTGKASAEIYEGLGLEIKGPIPETLKARSIDELDLLIDAVRGDRLPKQTQAFGYTLLEFSRERGIKDDRGDLAAMDIDKGKKAFVRNLLRDDGMQIDDVALAAQEAGFFEELGDDRVTIDQFLEAVSDELSGQEKRIGGDVEAQDQLQHAEDLDRFMFERGIDIDTATNEEIKAALREDVVEGEEFTQEAIRSKLEQNKQSIITASRRSYEGQIDFAIIDIEEIQKSEKIRDDDGNPAFFPATLITPEQSQGRDSFTIEFKDLTDEQKIGLGIFLSDIKEDDLHVVVDDYPADLEIDPEDLQDEFDDSIVSLELKDEAETEKRLKEEAKQDIEINTVEDALTHIDHHARAAAFRVALDQLGIEYRQVGSEGIASEYIYVGTEFDKDGEPVDELKVRFADHSRQSMLHEPADYNISDGDEQLAIQALEEISQEVLGKAVDRRELFQVDEQSSAFKKWAGTDKPVVEPEDIHDFDFTGEGPFVVKVFHGTTHDFDVFDATRGNIEGQFGKVNYFTSSESDAEVNYEGEGPDLTARIQQRAETLEIDLEDGDSTLQDDFEKSGLEVTDYVEAVARDELAGGQDQTLELYVKMENPFVVGDNEQWLQFVDNDAIETDAIEQVADAEGVTVDEVREDPDKYEDQIIEIRWAIEGDTENEIVEAIKTVAANNDFDASELAARIYEFGGEAKSDDIESLMRSSEDFSYAQDPETGALIGYQLVSEVIEELGYDSIVLKNAETRFDTMVMPPQTVHVHVFDSGKTNIKSVKNIGTFDPQDPRILYQEDGVENDLLNPIGKSKMVGEEKTLLDTDDLKISEADILGTKARSVRYVQYEKGRPVGVVQIGFKGKRTKNGVIQSIFVVEDRRREKIAANLLKRAREDYDVKHSTDLTDKGRAFKSADGTFYQLGDTLKTGDKLTQKDVQPFFSAVASAAAELKQEKGSGQQFLAAIKKTAGVKEEEISWIGLDEFLKGKKSVTKQEIIDYVDQNTLEVEEVTKVGLLDPKETKFDDYVLPGGKNYREVLLTMPERVVPDVYTNDNVVSVEPHSEPFASSPELFWYFNVPDNSFQISKSRYKTEAEAKEYILREKQPEPPIDRDFKGQHFEEKNILAHVRLNDRVGPDGEKILFIEEVQSDWHQEGRKKGYKTGVDAFESEREANKLRFDMVQELKIEVYNYNVLRDLVLGKNVTANDKIKALANDDDIAKRVKHIEKLFSDVSTERYGVPEAPLKKTWHEMAFRRVAHMAAEGGYDSIAWTPGEVQADRYDLSKKVQKIIYNNKDLTLYVYDENGKLFIEEEKVSVEKLSGIIGKEAADKLINNPTRTDVETGVKFLEGDDLKVGGEGMKAFYDKMLKNYASKFGKKFGAKVGVSEIKAIAKTNEEDLALLDELGVKAEGKPGQKVWILPVTDKMKETAKAEGFPLFQKEGKAPRGAITFGDKETVIKLTESANLSTFLHESGHLYLETFKNIQAKAPQQIQDDFQVILDWMGVKTGDEIKTEHHEQFARGFEAYLMEGKSPSVKLQAVFQRFRSWLVSIYRDMKNLNVELTPEIRGVMDRMLATDEEIEVAKNQMNYSALFEHVDESGMTESEFQAYHEAVDKSVQEAKDKVTRKTINELNRVQKKWWQEEEAKTRKEVEVGVYNNKVYQAWHLLTKGKYFDGVTPDEVSGIKLSRDILVSENSKEILKYLPKSVPPIYRKQGGYHPDAVASLFGISGINLIKGLTSLPPPKQVIDQQVKELMLERHGDMLNDGGIQEEAMAAVHNDTRGEVLALELKHLNRKSGREIPSAAAIIRDVAKRIIAEKKTSEAIKFSSFAASETRAAREAEQLVAKNDFIGASEAKRKQLLNHYMFMESKKAAESIEKILTYTKKFNKKGTRGNIEADYLEQIDDLLNRFDFRKGISLKQIDRRKSLNDFVEKKKEAGEPIIIPQGVLAEAQRRSYKDMSIQEVYGVRDSIKNLEHLGRKKEEYIRNKEKREIQDDADLITGAVKDNVKPQKISINPQRKGEKRKQVFWDAIATVTKAQTFIEKMDGGKVMGPVYSILKRDLDEASIASSDRMRLVGEELVAIIKKYYPGKGFKTIQNLEKDMVFIKSIGSSLSKSERLSIILNLGNEGNMKKLMIGRGWGQDVINEVKKSLDKNDYAFAQDIFDYINSFWSEIVVLEKERTGVAPEKVEAQAIQTPFGQIPGGYYPILYDSDLSKDARQHEIEQTFEDLSSGKFSRAQTKHGHTEARVEAVNRPMSLDLGLISRHLNQVVLDLEMSRAVTSTYKILNHKDVKEVIFTHMGKRVVDTMDLWVKDIAVGGAMTVDSASKILSNLRAGVTVGAMGLKYSTFIIQLSGYTHSLAELGPKYMVKGLFNVIGRTTSLGEMSQEVYEMSPFMASRATTMNKDIVDGLAALKGDGKEIAKLMFWPIVKSQQFVDIPTWLGAYEKALDEGREHKDAVRFADLIIEKAQGSGLTPTLSGVERGTISEKNRLSEFVKLWVSFYSYFNTKLNIAMRKANQTEFTDPVQVAKLAANYLLLFWGEALVGEWLLGRLPDDDDDESMLWWNLKLVLSQVAAVLPLARDVASSAKGFTGGPSSARGLESLTAGVLTAGRELSKISEDGEVDVIKIVQASLKTANVLSPIKMPVAQINTTLQALKRDMEGEDVPIVDYLRRPPR